MKLYIHKTSLFWTCFGDRLEPEKMNIKFQTKKNQKQKKTIYKAIPPDSIIQIIERGWVQGTYYRKMLSSGTNKKQNKKEE